MYLSSIHLLVLNTYLNSLGLITFHEITHHSMGETNMSIFKRKCVYPYHNFTLYYDNIYTFNFFGSGRTNLIVTTLLILPHARARVLQSANADKNMNLKNKQHGFFYTHRCLPSWNIGSSQSVFFGLACSSLLCHLWSKAPETN